VRPEGGRQDDSAEAELGGAVVVTRRPRSGRMPDGAAHSGAHDTIRTCIILLRL